MAREAGVSTATVSRYFNSPEVVARGTAARIRKAVERSGYVPNLVASGLASNRTRLVAIAIPAISQPLYASTIQAIADALVHGNYGVLMAPTGRSDENAERQLLSVVGRRPDAIILAGTVLSQNARKWLQRSGISIVETWDLPADPIDLVVGFSHSTVGVDLARHVLGQGRRRALVISSMGARAHQRSEGFVTAMRDAGVPEPYRTTAGAATYRYGRHAVAACLESGGDPDVVVCSSDWIAHGAADELKDRGRRVPVDVAVIGFGNLDFAAELVPALTTVKIDGQAIGSRVVEFLTQRAKGTKIRQPVVDVGFSLIVRESG